MNALLLVTIVTAIAGVGGTGFGGLVGSIFKKDSKKIVSLLLSFAGGVMLCIVCSDLLINAINKSHDIFTIIVWLLFGYGCVFILNYFIDKSTNHEVEHIDTNHPKTADDLDELIHSDHYNEHKKLNSAYQLFIGGVVMAAAIALHNLPEGMVIGASYAASSANKAINSGVIMAIVIGLHNIPEGMAVSVPLIAGGMKRPKAVFVTAITGAPTIIGAILGYYLGTLNPVMLAASLSFASGAMLYVVFGELLPEAILMWRSKLPAFATVIGVLVGIVIIYA